MADLHEEVKLYTRSREREQIDNEADVFAIIQTIQMLEKAYIKDSVTSYEYTQACSKLLVQCKAAFKLISDHYNYKIEEFIKRNSMDCPAALERIREDRPITIKDDSGNVSKIIADVVSLFITVSDRLKLEIRAMDEIHPDLKELNEALNKMSTLPDNFSSTLKVKKWLDILEEMAAHEELSGEQARQMIFDLDAAQNDFVRFLQ